MPSSPLTAILILSNTAFSVGSESETSFALPSHSQIWSLGRDLTFVLECKTQVVVCGGKIGHWKEARDNFNFGGAYPTRIRLEGGLINNAIKAGNLPASPPPSPKLY